MGGYNELICNHKSSLLDHSHQNCRGPFQDLLGSEYLQVFDMVNYRNLLEPHQAFGTRGCRTGFEGTVNQTFDRFMSCHLLIYIPSYFEAWTLTWLIILSIFSVSVTVAYVYIRRKMKRKYLLVKIE